MEQRPLRLGDIVDDYCPRERRITNHAIVVMSGDDVSQTRCTACEAEHPFKHAKAPLKRKRDENGALFDEVLSGVLKPKAAAAQAHADAEAVAVAEAPVAVAVAVEEMQMPAAVIVEAAAEAAAAEPESEPAVAAWGHRPLIRATLPRTEGQAPTAPRPLPDFTIRQQGQRGYGQPNTNNGSRRGGGGGGFGGGQNRRDNGGRSQGRSRNSR